jgi:hypothetical protein
LFQTGAPPSAGLFCVGRGGAFSPRARFYVGFLDDKRMGL